MSELAVIPADPTALDVVPDAAAAMVALVDQARSMLAQATGMEGLADVIEWKSRAEAIRVYTQQKDMGHEAELSAAEIVRRAERRIGQLIRDGQAAGEIRAKGEHGPLHDQKNSPNDYLAPGEAQAQVWGLTDGVTDEQFETALAEAKQEGNMSRANVARKVKDDPITRLKKAAKDNPVEPPRNMPLAERANQIRTLAGRNFTSVQIADELGLSPDRVRDLAKRAEIAIPADAVFGGRFRKVDPNRIIDAIVDAATPEPVSLALVAYSELDRERLDEWVSSLSVAIRSLTTIKKNIQKELTRDQG